MNKSTIRLLMVDDNPLDIEIVRAMLAQYTRAVFELDALNSTEHALDRLRSRRYDLVLLDHNMPREDGLAFLKRLTRAEDVLPPVIMLTGDGGERLAAEVMRAGAYDYFPKRSINSLVLARAIHQALEKYQLDQQLENTENVIFTLAAAVEAKDETTSQHLQRMTQFAGQLGAHMGLPQHDLLLLRYGAILHDIGKVGVSEAVLCKPGPLDADEWEEMRSHPVMGEKICAQLRFARDVCPVIRHHHERWDGDGYADGLRGEDIPLLARIISVVDAFDAMTSDRPYRKALSMGEAVNQLREGAGSQWDPDIVRTFVNSLDSEAGPAVAPGEPAWPPASTSAGEWRR